ncbi:ergothioneine biosynthesis protein EgtB [Trichocoleus sp. ST-U3]
MKFKSINSEVARASTLDERRQQIKQSMQRCRAGTLALFEGINYDTFCRQVHPDFSPIGWHLGHIAYTEALWLLVRTAGKTLELPVSKGGQNAIAGYQRLFAADGLPKMQRVYLPLLTEIRCYLHTVREQVFDYLEVAPLDEQERLWRWLIQHESQHSETISFVLQLQRRDAQFHVGNRANLPETCNHPILEEMVEIAAGEFEMGNESIEALDNERPVHRVYLDTYWIDRYPVTCGQYRAFMEAGGYQNARWWTEAGWKWLQENPVNQPLYWAPDTAWDNHPVCGVSGYEAQAYARFVGKRLPTEAEWEKAASWDAIALCRRTYPWGEAELDLERCNHDNLAGQTTPVNAYPSGQSAYGCYDMLGNVWEWTSTCFDGYDGFVSYPYVGYSKTYFDGEHQVLRGGSWATRPAALRSSFRNWYYPSVRQILSGFRCAK